MINRAKAERVCLLASVLCVSASGLWNVSSTFAQTEPAGAEPAPSASPTVSPEPSPSPTPAASPSAQPAIRPLDAARLSPPPAPDAGPRVAATGSEAAHNRHASREQEEADEEDKKERASPMGWLSVSLKVGYGHINSGSLRNPTYDPNVAAKLDQLATFASDGMLSANELAALPPDVRKRIPAGLSSQQLSDLVTRLTHGTQSGACTPLMRTCTTPERRGVQIGLTLHVGGDGFGWDAEPYVMAGSNAFAIGVYTGPKFDIHVADPLYIGFGLGGKVAYVTATGWRYGADIYGRIPVHLTYYVSPNFALELEGSFGAGVSGYATDPKNYVITSAPEFKFGAARSWDLTFGMRFP